MRFFFLCCLSFTLSANAQNKKDMDSARFGALILQSFDDIFSNWKIEKISEYYADDFTLLENGEVWNKDSVALLLTKRIASGQTIKRVNAINVLQFRIDGGTAWGSYYNDAVISRNGGPERKVRWLESVVLVRQKNGWKIQTLHSTIIPQKS